MKTMTITKNQKDFSEPVLVLVGLSKEDIVCTSDRIIELPEVELEEGAE